MPVSLIPSTTDKQGRRKARAISRPRERLINTVASARCKDALTTNAKPDERQEAQTQRQPPRQRPGGANTALP